MTALCNGGNSGPKLGVEAGVAYSSAKAAQLLETYGAAWAMEAIPFLVLPTLLVNAFCQADPPGVPNFTTAEANALLQLNFTADFFSGLPKLGQLIQYLAWYDLCQCTSGSLVPMGAAAPPPNGTYVVHNPVPLPAAHCGPIFQISSQENGSGNAAYGSAPLVYSGGETSASIFVSIGASPAPTSTATVTVVAGYADGTSETLVTINYTGAQVSQTFPVALKLGLTGFVDNWIGLGGSGNVGWFVKITTFCNGQPPVGTVTPCCPPDQVTQAQLNAILKLTTLIQRQIAPFGYVASTVHGNLQGNGELTVQGLLGVKVLPTSSLANYGHDGGDPDTLWLDSWINWGNADGWTAREFLRVSPHLSLPPAAGQFTKLGYSLAPGLTVSVTELVREA